MLVSPTFRNPLDSIGRSSSILSGKATIPGAKNGRVLSSILSETLEVTVGLDSGEHDGFGQGVFSIFPMGNELLGDFFVWEHMEHICFYHFLLSSSERGYFGKF